MFDSLSKRFKHILACASVIAAASALGMASGKAVNAAESTKTVSVTLDQEDLRGVYVKTDDSNSVDFVVNYTDASGAQQSDTKTLPWTAFTVSSDEQSYKLAPPSKSELCVNFDIPMGATNISFNATSNEQPIVTFDQPIRVSSTADLSDTYQIPVSISKTHKH